MRRGGKARAQGCVVDEAWQAARGGDDKAARATEENAASGEAVPGGGCKGAMANGEVEGTGSNGVGREGAGAASSDAVPGGGG